MTKTVNELLLFGVSYVTCITFTIRTSHPRTGQTALDFTSYHLRIRNLMPFVKEKRQSKDTYNDRSYRNLLLTRLDSHC